MKLNANRNGQDLSGWDSSRMPSIGWPAEGASCPGIARERRRRRLAAGFTFIETVVATVVAGIFLPSLLAGLAFGFSSVKTSRENLRATQVIVQKMEAIRLSPYKLLQNSSYYPASATEYYAPSSQTNAPRGTAYQLSYNWAPGPATLPPSYRSNMVLVTVSASWTDGRLQHTQSMQSFVARYGIQRYVSGN